METNQAKRAGSRQTLKVMTAGVIQTYLAMAWFTREIFWLQEFGYPKTILFGLTVLYVTGSFLGRFAGTGILLRKWNALLTGIGFSFLIIWIAIFITSLVGFFGEGLPNSADMPETFKDYILKPLLLGTTFGGIPIIACGIWLGILIKNTGKKALKTATPIV